MQPADAQRLACQDTLAYSFNKLQSPAYAKYNSFLNQKIFLELASGGSMNHQVQITLYDFKGRELLTKNFTVPGNTQKDIDINKLLETACKDSCPNLFDLDGNNVVDTYGLIKIEFEDRNAESPLIGRLSHYRPEDDRFSFAFTKDISNGLGTASSYLIANTIDASSQGNKIHNWAEVVSIGKDQDFLLEIYNSEGTFLYSTSFRVLKNAEVDIRVPFTHSAAFLLKLTNQTGGQHLFSLSRYAEKDRNPNSFRYGFNSSGSLGTARAQYFFARNRKELKGLKEINYLEVANTSDETAIGTLKLRGEKGELLLEREFTVGPLSQRHISLSALLDIFSETLGQVELVSNVPASLIAQSVFYLIETDSNEIQTAYVSSSKSPDGYLVRGSTNTFLGMENELMISSVKDAKHDALSTTSVIPLAAHSTLATMLNTASQFSYDIFSLSTPGTSIVFGEILRTRKVGEEFDFVMPVNLVTTGFLEEPFCGDL